MGIKLEGIEEVEAWSSSVMLEPGWHLVKVKSAEETRSPNQGVPQVEIRFAGESGDIRDWLTITPEAMGRVKSFLDACRVGYQNGADFPTEAIHGKELAIYVGERQREDARGGYRTVREVKAFAPAQEHRGNGPAPNSRDMGATGEDLPF
jgi:hypothetical protein